MTTLDKIRKILDDNVGAQDFLDNFVHDQASAMATGINNDGLKAQLEFLNQRGVIDETVLISLEQAVEE